MCDWKPDFDRLDERVDKIEARLTTIESASSLTRESIAAVNANLETLSQQITNMDKRIIEEKQKWGDVTRSMARWTLRAILVVVVYAAGVNVTKTLLTEFLK